jgi:hypothetical protein
VTAFDQDALVAALDLVGRSGATEAEVGFLHDDVPPEEAGWYAHAKYQGARVTVEAEGPVEAAEGLARRLLHGAMCRRCGEPIQLADDKPGCRWTRQGAKWTPGCGKPIDQSIPVRR